MKRAAGCVLTAAVVLTILAGGGPACATEQAQYIGTWSNGRGERLVIMENTLQFNKDKALKYRDLTEEPDGESFELEIVGVKNPNGFGGNILVLEFDGEEMKMTAYGARGDIGEEDKITAAVTWSRDE